MPMESIDRDLQKRVWQRVQGEPAGAAQPQRRENLKLWLLLAQENAAAYQQLARQMKGKQGERLRRMAQELQHGISCARGICRLRGEQVKKLPLKPSTQPPQNTLTKCYHRELRLWEEAVRRASDPEYGPVFDKLSRQAASRCAQLTEILGELE